MEGDFFNKNYDFKVPKVDFNNPDAFDPELEAYFDVNHEIENEIPEVFGPTEVKRSREESPAKRPRRSLRSTPSQPRTESKTQAEQSTLPNNETPSQSSSRPRTRSMGAPLTNQGSAKSKERRTSAKRDHHQPANLCSSLAEWGKKKEQARKESPNQARRLPLKALPPTAAKGVKSSEQLELEKIEALRMEAQKHKRRAERSHRRVLSSGPTMIPKPTVSATKVEEFAFATDKRIHDNKSGKSNSTNSKEFTTMLRHYEPMKATKKGPTVPIETNLYSLKRKHSEDRPSVKDPAPLWSKTPERFHTLPRNAKFMPPSNKRRRSQSYTCKVTLPITPKLESNKRTRPVHAVSQKEQEEKEAAEIKKYKFKARPINENIFKNRCTGVPRKKAYEATVAVSPNFATDKRIQYYHATKEEDESHTSFHARPLSKKMLEGPQGIKKVNPKPATYPMSPAFALKNRLRSGNKSDLEVEEDHIVRANPLPNMDDVFMPKIQRSIVRVEPFSEAFDARNQQAVRHKEQKVAQLREEQERELEEYRAFKARNPGVLHKEPFIPQKSTVPVTDVSALKLNTSRRHEERQEWETYKAENERMMAQQKQEEQRRREEEERREVERLRRDAVHKAQPVRHYRNVIVQKSNIPLTTAHSPRFSTRLRERNTNLQ